MKNFPADIINAARIRVAGLGGLGLVAMAGVVTAFGPARIRESLGVGLILGVGLAAALIAHRRGAPMPSSGRAPGANTTLSIDE